MKDLPNVSSFPINKKLNNYQESYRSSFKEEHLVNKHSKNILHEINNIFRSSSYIYKCKVRIKTKEDIFEKTVIGKYNGYLLTINGEKILINDILDIERI